MYFIKNPEKRINNLNKLIKNSYIQYSTSVILQRSIPNIKDGLKPVQRRIVYAMFKEKMFNNKGFEKSAGVVGEVLKNYHPHGDASVYDSLVRLGQPWSIRYPLIDPQGNFGSLDGDSPAAYRYTECKLSKIAEELLVDIPNNTVNFVLNYKKSLREPEVLPSLIPNLLLNGSYGIAVGVTTSIPPHNICEVLLACKNMIDFRFTLRRRVFRVLGGPDFPLKSIVYRGVPPFNYFFNQRDFLTFKGCLKVEILNFESSFYFKITITSLPYNVSRYSLLTKISTLIKCKSLSDVLCLKDNSSQETSITLFLKKDTYPLQTLKSLYENTSFKSSSGVRMLALHKKKPSYTNVFEILKTHIKYRLEILKKKFLAKVKGLRLRVTLLKGLKVVFNKITQAFRYISFLNSRVDVLLFLKNNYSLKEVQVEFILNLRLVQTSNKEKLKILEEYRGIKSTIFWQEAKLHSYSKMKFLLLQELELLLSRYVSRRRSLVVKQGHDKFRGGLTSVNLDRKVFLFVTKEGGLLFKYIPLGDLIEEPNQPLVIKRSLTDVFNFSLYKDLFLITAEGFIFSIKSVVKEVPIFKDIVTGSKVIFHFSVTESELRGKRLIIVTRQGKVVVQKISQGKKLKVKLINLDDSDGVADCTLVDIDVTSIGVFTKLGRCIRIAIDDLRVYKGRTKGLSCIRLFKYDFVVSVVNVTEGEDVLMVYEDGYVKKNPFSVYKLQRRSGRGVRCSLNASKLTGCRSVGKDSKIVISTSLGKSYIVKSGVLKLTGRMRKGVRLVKLKNLDKVISIIKT